MEFRSIRVALPVTHKKNGCTMSYTELVEPHTTLVLTCGRDRLLCYIPRKSRAAEIGVYKGKFSRKILSRAKPAHLTLVDAWNLHFLHSERHTEQAFARLAKTVPRALKWRYPLADIQACRSSSAQAAKRFKSGEFDWVYIDADHSYEGVRSDLQAWVPKVRKDGLIFGHDFTDQDRAFGVIDAVRDFTEVEGYRLLCVTTDYFPTFALARDLSGFAGAFLHNIFHAQKFLYQVDTDLILSMRHRRYAQGTNKTGLLSTLHPPPRQ